MSSLAPVVPIPLVNPEDLALRLGVPVRTIYAWRYKGTGPRGLKIGKHLRFREADLQAWIETRSDDVA